MARPQRSTKDTFLDTFADFDVESQEQLLDTCQLLHRQAKRSASKQGGRVALAEAYAALTIAAGKEEVSGSAQIEMGEQQ